MKLTTSFQSFQSFEDSLELDHQIELELKGQDKITLEQRILIEQREQRQKIVHALDQLITCW